MYFKSNESKVFSNKIIKYVLSVRENKRELVLNDTVLRAISLQYPLLIDRCFCRFLLWAKKTHIQYHYEIAFSFGSRRIFLFFIFVNISRLKTYGVCWVTSNVIRKSWSLLYTCHVHLV